MNDHPKTMTRDDLLAELRAIRGQLRGVRNPDLRGELLTEQRKLEQLLGINS